MEPKIRQGCYCFHLAAQQCTKCVYATIRLGRMELRRTKEDLLQSNIWLPRVDAFYADQIPVVVDLAKRDLERRRFQVDALELDLIMIPMERTVQACRKM
jgi:hypothetical protein